MEIHSDGNPHTAIRHALITLHYIRAKHLWQSGTDDAALVGRGRHSHGRDPKSQPAQQRDALHLAARRSRQIVNVMLRRALTIADGR